jgi:hypothetical protein
MSPVRLRPDIRLPWQAIATFAAALYVLRSALRGWDFRPNVLDALVFGSLAVILLLRPLMVRLLEGDDEE